MNPDFTKRHYEDDSMSDYEKLEQQVKDLQDEVNMYRWKEKKAIIIKKLGLHEGQLTSYDYTNSKKILDEEKKKMFKEGRLFTFIDNLYIHSKIDSLLTSGYTVEEIIKAINEFFNQVVENFENGKVEEEE